ncbi:MAG: Spy/CpxP family protein refolding chaperone [Gemmatimonadales bacterium]
MKTSTWKASFLLLAVFLGGAVAGGATVALTRPDRGARIRGGHEDRRDRDDHLKSLARDLNLTPAQEDSVRAIVDRYRASMDSIWREVGPRFGTLRDSISSDIRKQLTPEQVNAYNEMIQRYRRDREEPPGKP